MSRLPIIGGDNNIWGSVLVDYLSVAHNSDGTQKPGTSGGSASGTAGGDLSGTYPNPNVVSVFGGQPIAKNNLAAAVPPTVNNDNTQGYSIGSTWIDTTHNKVWQATSVATGAAVWNPVGTRRLIVVTQSATPVINTDSTDIASITGLGTAINTMSTNLTGTPMAGQVLIVEITDNGSGQQITWGGSFEASSIALPSSTNPSAKLTTGFIYNGATSKWRCIGVS